MAVGPARVRVSRIALWFVGLVGSEAAFLFAGAGYGSEELCLMRLYFSPWLWALRVLGTIAC